MLPDIQPGNTKILYFFNCLLDGMHTTIPYICDFSRCRLNVRLTAYIQPLLRGHKYRVWSLFGSCLWRLEENQNSCWRDLRIPRKAVIFQICFRACLKNHSSNLHTPIYGIFCLHSVAVARYAALIQAKSPANCDVHLAESIFQTRSREEDGLSSVVSKLI